MCFHHCRLILLLLCCDAFTSNPSQLDLTPGFHGDGPHLFQEHVRSKQETPPDLVQVPSRLVHDMRRPEVHQMFSSTVKMEPEKFSHHVLKDGGRTQDAEQETQDAEQETQDSEQENQDAEQETQDAEQETQDAEQETQDAEQETQDAEQENQDVEEEMERMVHISRGSEDFSDSETDVLSQEVSGFYGSDSDDRTSRDHLHGPEPNHTHLDALIGFTSSSFQHKPSAGLQDLKELQEVQEQRGPPVLEVDPLQRELRKSEKKKEEEEVQSSGDEVLHSSITESTGTSGPETDTGTSGPETDTGTSGPETDTGTSGPETDTGTSGPETDTGTSGPETDTGTSGPETDTGTDFGLLRSFTLGSKGAAGDEHTTVEVSGPIKDWMEMTTPLQSRQQVVCLDWSELAGRGYVVLNMTHNFNCEEFRVLQGVSLLKALERVFSRRMNSPEGSWMIYLSKPTHERHQLLMNVASERGVIATKDVLNMLGEISKHLHSLSIQSFSSAGSCSSRPSHTRRDYAKLFIVLVIIGSFCIIIITSGFIYICWKRRIPATKTQFRAEELHFVENGCHDNPTLDVSNDGQAEMQEKKLSTNGLTGGGEGGGDKCNRWQVFVNQAVTEDDEEEQDTHL